MRQHVRPSVTDETQFHRQAGFLLWTAEEILRSVLPGTDSIAVQTRAISILKLQCF